MNSAQSYDGILFDTGDIIIMDCLTLTGNGNIEFKIHPLVKATLSSYLEFNPDHWTSIIELAAISWEAGGLRASCGGGGYGSDGFVAVCRLEDNYLNWIAFFQSSNPFDKIDIVGTDVIAVSTYGHVWTFPIQHPERVKVKGHEVRKLR